MTLDARRIALQGLGFAALAIALQGFVPAEAQATVQASGGAWPTQEARDAAQTADLRAYVRSLAEAAREKKRLAEAARQATEAARARTEVPEVPDALQLLREQISQASETATRRARNPEATYAELAIPRATPGPATAHLIEAQAAAINDQKRSNRNRIALLMALLISER